MMLGSAHVALAVSIASGLYLAAVKVSGTRTAGRLATMAADVLDHTAPEPALALAYQDKPANVSDPEFLAANLARLSPVAPALWPRRKVRSTEWGEYTRVMRGLDLAFGSACTCPRERQRDLQAVRAFSLANIDLLDASAQSELAQLLQALQPETTA